MLQVSNILCVMDQIWARQPWGHGPTHTSHRHRPTPTTLAPSSLEPRPMLRIAQEEWPSFNAWLQEQMNIKVHDGESSRLDIFISNYIYIYIYLYVYRLFISTYTELYHIHIKFINIIYKSGYQFIL